MLSDDTISLRHLPRQSSKNCDLQFANNDRFKANYSIDINLRWARDYVCLYVKCVCMLVCQLRASFISFGHLLRCALKRIVNIMKVYIERNKKQVKLIRFRKQISTLYSRLRLRSEYFQHPRHVYSLFARWHQLATTKLITIQCHPIR